MNEAILVVEDEEVLARNVVRYLQQHGYIAQSAGSAREALALLDDFRPDCALLDYNLPGMDGLQLMAALREREPDLPVIIMTGQGNVQLAVEAMKAGAQNYLSKPVALDEVRLAVAGVFKRGRTEQTLDYYKKRDARGGIEMLGGDADSMRAVRSQLQQIVTAESQLREGAPPAVLITGETGTGKELVARALHFDGPRAGGPFVEINCAALPPNLLESELFGHERGAFTDAKQRKVGLVEAADGGTLFLDEIGDIDAQTQVKLLKLLEERSVRRLGSVRDVRVDVRIIAATHQPLEQMVQRGSFRADLFFRLRMVAVHLPPLRDRGDDVLQLAERFLTEQRKRYGKPRLYLTDSARAVLRGYAWPGNVRELRNMIEQAVLLATQDAIEPRHLPVCETLAPAPVTAAPAAAAPKAAQTQSEAAPKSLVEIERAHLLDALRRCGWNVTQAARLLDISRDTMRYRIEKHGLQPDR
ncbi:MAG: sigma-54 dependent transcriptional regulator [Burkholderiaceae bacterium]|jgi:two-component system, NtrC family, response regulator AtoC|nr:sigma-54 dependent transcriptional regulator [Burkholderiaceae bacterium]